MKILFDFVIIIALLLVIIKSADFLEVAFVAFSRKVGFSPFLIGFTIVAFISSLPELSVALNSARQGVPDLSIGNLLGATMVLLTLVIGANAIKHKKLPFIGSFNFSYLLLSLLVISLLVTTIVDQRLEKWEGIMLTLAYAFTCIFIVHNTPSKFTEDKVKKQHKSGIWKLLLMGTIGMVVLLVASDLMVNKTIDLAVLLGVSNNLLGLIMLGLGTNLPEITLLIRSKNLAEDKLAAGNFIGSAAVNVPIMGLLAILSPHSIGNFVTFTPVLAGLAFTIIIFAFLAFTGKMITRKEGFILITVYLAWLGFELITALAVA